MIGIPSSQTAIRAAIGASIGGVLWAIKSVSILAADYQPALTFEFAPFFMGFAAVGVAMIIDESRRTARKVMLVLARLAVLTGGLAAILYIGTGDSGAFGLALMVSMLSLLAVLGYGGWLVRDWSITPIAVSAITLVALPVGGALAEIDERLLEVPLLIVSAAWISLGLRFLADTHKPASRPSPSNHGQIPTCQTSER